MSLQFSANISTIFKDLPFADRFKAAEENGFKAVEIQAVESDIESIDIGNLKVDLINVSSNDYPYGFAGVPGMEERFCNFLNNEIMNYYKALNFKKLHIMCGEVAHNVSRQDQIDIFINNLRSLVEGDFLENINVIGVIEPICEDVNEDYVLNSFDTAIDIIKEVHSPQIKLLLDVYHLQMLTGNAVEHLEKYYPYSGHVQVSQHPGRTEPFHPDGVIDYKCVFDFLRRQHHQGYIGLEYYCPSGSIESSLAWLKDYNV